MVDIKTYQDLIALGDNVQAREDFIREVIREHKTSELYRIAEEAEENAVELPEDDMRGWTIAALKGYCAEHEIPCKGCKVKADYLNAIGLKPVVNRVAED